MTQLQLYLDEKQEDQEEFYTRLREGASSQRQADTDELDAIFGQDRDMREYAVTICTSLAGLAKREIEMYVR